MPITAELDHSEKAVRLFATQVRMQTNSQAQSIADFGKAGFDTAGITRNQRCAVNAAIQRSKKPPKKTGDTA
jgi:ribosomal protein L1